MAAQSEGKVSRTAPPPPVEAEKAAELGPLVSIVKSLQARGGTYSGAGTVALAAVAGASLSGLEA